MASSRDYRLRYTYGITEDEYTSILTLQENACAICRRPADLEENDYYVAKRSKQKSDLTYVDFSVGSVTQDSKSGGTIQINWKLRELTFDAPRQSK